MAMKLFDFVSDQKQFQTISVLSFPKNPLSYMSFYLNLRQHLEKNIFFTHLRIMDYGHT